MYEMGTSTASLGPAMGAGSEPTVTVVIGANAAAERLEACLAALEPQRDGVEVLVHDGRGSPGRAARALPVGAIRAPPGRLVPSTGATGSTRASGDDRRADDRADDPGAGLDRDNPPAACGA